MPREKPSLPRRDDPEQRSPTTSVIVVATRTDASVIIECSQSWSAATPASATTATTDARAPLTSHAIAPPTPMTSQNGELVSTSWIGFRTIAVNQSLKVVVRNTRFVLIQVTMSFTGSLNERTAHSSGNVPAQSGATTVAPRAATVTRPRPIRTSRLGMSLPAAVRVGLAFPGVHPPARLLGDPVEDDREDRRSPVPRRRSARR